MAKAAPGRRAGTDETRFVADVMLGRLARWLRVLGYDVLYASAAEDAAIVRTAVRERRAVLTRDRALLASRLLRRGPRGLLVESDDLRAQLLQVLDAFGLRIDEERLFSRCAACNARIRSAGADELHGRVPPYVLRSAPRLAVCTGCDKPYWEGTHRALALGRIRRLLGDRAPGRTAPVPGLPSPGRGGEDEP